MTTENHKIFCIMVFIRIVLYSMVFMRIVCVMVFIHIIAFKIIFSMKKGYVYVWERVSFAGMLFNVIINVIIF